MRILDFLSLKRNCHPTYGNHNDNLRDTGPPGLQSIPAQAGIYSASRWKRGPAPE
jgi:hypothetical protein